MFAEFVFTVTEAKYLIAKAVAQTERVQKAFHDGILAMHPSSSTYFLMKELTGGHPQSDGKVWVTGLIVPKALCVEATTQIRKADQKTGLTKSLEDPGKYPHTLVINKGEVVSGWTINDLIEKMGRGDIYVKGVNAVDFNKRVAVLRGSMAEGTIGKMVKAAEANGFEIICPVGVEKLIPEDLRVAEEFVKTRKDYSMGVKCNILSFNATTVNEMDALTSLTGVKAMAFSAGGLDGAEGAICIAVEGTNEQVEKAIEIAESVKGAVLPAVILPDCLDCSMPTCHFCGTEKHWIKNEEI